MNAALLSIRELFQKTFKNLTVLKLLNSSVCKNEQVALAIRNY